MASIKGFERMLTQDGHFLSSLQVGDKKTLEAFFETAQLLEPVAQGRMATRILDGAIIANLFFEASTRTRLSFEAAAMRLGAKCISVVGAQDSSISKGESYADTGRVVSGYADAIVMRCNAPDILQDFVSGAVKPVLNAGSGGDEHPTQALLDIYTAKRALGARGKTLEGAHIAFVGDLKYGRTVHSLIKLLRLYEGVHIHLVSPDGLGLPQGVIDVAQQAGLQLSFYAPADCAQAYAQADMIYATRLQKERLEGGVDLAAYPRHLRIDAPLLDAQAKADVFVMHPLPRDSREGSNDLPLDASDARAEFFNQADNGVPIRMALLCRVFGVSDAAIERSCYKPEWAA